MKNIKTFLIALTAVLTAAAPSFASITLSNLVSGSINRLEDDNFEGALLGTSNSSLDVGDVLYGVFFIQALHAPVTTTSQQNVIASDSGAGPGTTFAGIFVTEVTGKSGGGGGPANYTFGPASAGNSFVWSNIMGYTPANNQTMIAVFQDSSDPRVDQSNTASASDGTPLFEFGFTPDKFESWTAFSNTDNPFDMLNPLSATFRVSLSETANFSPVLFNPFTISSFTTAAQLHGTGVINFDPSALNTPMPLFSDTDFWIRPTTTPEPISLAIWGSLIAGGAAVCYRKRALKS